MSIFGGAKRETTSRAAKIGVALATAAAVVVGSGLASKSAAAHDRHGHGGGGISFRFDGWSRGWVPGPRAYYFGPSYVAPPAFIYVEPPPPPPVYYYAPAPAPERPADGCVRWQPYTDGSVRPVLVPCN